MAFDFPSSPTENQVFTPLGGPTYIFKSPVWTQVSSGSISPPTAEARNRIVNPCMQISQEQGDAAGAAAGRYAVDQWQWPIQASTGVFTTQRMSSAPTPNGSKYRLLMSVTTADTSIAAGDAVYATQNIEGVCVADFLWGTAGAKQVILRFGFRGPAGTYSIRLTNAASNRSYIANFTISAGQANTDTEQLFVIPGDTTGTWLTDWGIGIALHIVQAVGTTYQGVAGWQAGSFFGTSANTNGVATAGAQFQIWDVGLYRDPQNTGLPPLWQFPDEAEELRACERYWFRSTVHVNASTASLPITLPATMRITPAVTGGGAGFAVQLGQPDLITVYQTTRASATLVFNSRM